MSSLRSNPAEKLNHVPERPQLTPAWIHHARAVHALLLRNIKTRAGSSYLGFLFASLVPLAHIAILLLIYHFVGRRAPIGNDISMYLFSAILPYVIWSYTHKNVIRSLSENKALLLFPSIKTVDVIASAMLAEIINATIITLVTISILPFISSDVFVFDVERSILCLIVSYLLGASTGSVFAVFGVLSQAFLMIGFLIIPVYWVTSGILFIPSGLPEQLQVILFFFPLTHIVDMARESMFPGYVSNFHSLVYVFAIILGNTLAFFVLSRLLRNAIIGK